MDSRNLSAALNRIWGEDAFRVKFILTTAGKVYAECEDTMDRRLLTQNNYFEQLDDMFYDYCVANASEMGIS